uniref:6-phosphogluconolactonase n=1 Tax=Fopius arisanus TaxID=64838 RepID=A0A0C9RQ55_9HYME
MAQIIVEPDAVGVVSKLAEIIEKNANDAIKANDIFKIGLSGGSLVKFLSDGLPAITTDWSKWRFFFCDERVVPFDHDDSTFGVYKTNLIDKIPITEDQFITIDSDFSAVEAANDYIKKMAVYFPPDSLPRFDLLLLGMGPDGHTCSLFPGHRLLEETSRAY